VVSAQLENYDVISPALDDLLKNKISGFVQKKHYVQLFTILVLVTVIYSSIVFVKNLEKRQRSEKALLQAEKKYRDIFENAINGIFQIAPDGSYISANPALARIYG